MTAELTELLKETAALERLLESYTTIGDHYLHSLTDDAFFNQPANMFISNAIDRCASLRRDLIEIQRKLS